MKNLEQTINEIKSVFDYNVKIEILVDDLYYHWINIIIKNNGINTYELDKISRITGDYFLGIYSLRKDVLKITAMIDKEPI